MTARLRLLRPEGRPEAVDLAEGRAGALHIELPGLGQERPVAEVVGLEERSRGFADRAGQDRRVDPHEVTLVEEVVDRLLDLGAHLEAGPLHVRTQPQMPVVEEEFDAVLLRLDRELRAGADQLDRGNGQLVSARRARVGAHEAAQRDAALLRQRGGQLPDLGRKLRLDQDALHDTRPVAQHHEGDARVDAQGGDPAGDGDGFADVAGQVADQSAVLAGRSLRGAELRFRCVVSHGQGSSPEAQWLTRAAVAGGRGLGRRAGGGVGDGREGAWTAGGRGRGRQPTPKSLTRSA